jgi:hypothetical protein
VTVFKFQHTGYPRFQPEWPDYLLVFVMYQTPVPHPGTSSRGADQLAERINPVLQGMYLYSMNYLRHEYEFEINKKKSAFDYITETVRNRTVTMSPIIPLTDTQSFTVLARRCIMFIRTDTDFF